MLEFFYYLDESTARITPRGILYKNIYYSCSRAIAEQWFASIEEVDYFKIPVLSTGDLSFIHLLLPDGEPLTAYALPSLKRPTTVELKAYYKEISILKKKMRKVKNKKIGVYL